MSSKNKLVIDGDWWLFRSEETRRDLRAVVGMIRERLQLRRPSEAVIILPDTASTDADSKLLAETALICELMNIPVVLASNIEEALFSVRETINTNGDLAVWLSGRSCLYPLLASGAVIEKNVYGDLVTFRDIAGIGLDTYEKIEDWLALSGTPKPIKKMGPAKAADILRSKSLKDLFENDPESRIEQAAIAQQGAILKNKETILGWGKTPAAMSLNLAWTSPPREKVEKILSEYKARGWNDWCDPETRLPMNSIENPLSAKAQITAMRKHSADLWGVKLVSNKSDITEIHIGRGIGNIKKWVFKINKHNRHVMLSQIAPFLSDPNVKKVLSSNKDVSRMLLDAGLEGAAGVVGDMSALQAYLNEKHVPYADLEVEEYAPFHEERASQLSPRQKKYYLETETEIGRVLAGMEHTGVSANQYKLDVQQLELQNKIQFAARFVEETIGSRPDETDAFRALLRTSLGLPDTSNLSASVLKPLAHKSPLASKILEWRQSHTLSTQFIVPLINHADSVGKIRTQYSSTVAVTGRLSSSKPALQNLPPEARKALESKTDTRSLLSIDYKQMEIVALAIASRDKYLLNSLLSGRDIHKDAASKMFNVPYNKVTAEQRTSAKEINFGIIYGMSTPTIAKKLGISRSEANELFARHVQQFPAIHEFVESRKESATSLGYIETLGGRKIHIAGLKSENFKDRSAALRKVVNYEMQGSTAEMVKSAMIECDSLVCQKPGSAELIMQIHDELVFDVEDAEINKVLEDASSVMKNACIKAWGMDVGRFFRTEAKAGKNLGELTSIPPQKARHESAGIGM